MVVFLEYQAPFRRLWPDSNIRTLSASAGAFTNDFASLDAEPVLYAKVSSYTLPILPLLFSPPLQSSSIPVKWCSVSFDSETAMASIQDHQAVHVSLHTRNLSSKLNSTFLVRAGHGQLIPEYSERRRACATRQG